MITWKLWTSLPQVKLWEAVALVLEIDPRSLEHSPHGWMTAGPGREAAPVFISGSFPSKEKRLAFEEALDFAERAASYSGPIRILSTAYTGMNKRKAGVSLRDVAAFFVKAAWPDIPATLLALMSTGADVPPTAGANNLPTGGASSVRKDVPRPAASDAEMVAIRRCAQLVASLLKPHERQNAVRRLLGQARAGRGVLAFRLEHLGVLYYPSDHASASALVASARAARATGHLPALGPEVSTHATTDDLITWAEGPEPAPDSPLLFWLPPKPVDATPGTPAPARESAATAAEPVPSVADIATVADDSPLPWWRTDYDIPELVQNIGNTLHSQGKRTSKVAIAKDIEKRINAIERSKGRDRKSPNWDTIRGVLPNWRKSSV